MKKKLLIALSVFAVVALSVAGTVAFLTSKDASANVFTIGEVEIDLLSNDLSSITKDGKILLMPNNTDKVAANYKIANTGDSAAYVWLTVKIPVALEDTGDAAANNIIHWNFPAATWYGNHKNAAKAEKAVADGYVTTELTEAGYVADDKTWLVNESFGDAKKVENIDGVDYNVYNIMYNGALAAEETTNVGVSSIFVDERVDYVDGKWALVEKGVVTPIEFDFNSGASIKVEAHAIQANGFDTVQEAFAAYQKQWNK